jgi:hypothetical protein
MQARCAVDEHMPPIFLHVTKAHFAALSAEYATYETIYYPGLIALGDYDKYAAELEKMLFKEMNLDSQLK